ncbi:MAG: RNA polymerase sporulation sigma factor SigK [Clostridia bacterium]|nr:RNA polymerase sporulation sigma factor SigK [Bacillota bacterium]MBO2520669.1 RNA polymerase sporulation sigma factor SigK [Bacillota bacterium]
MMSLLAAALSLFKGVSVLVSYVTNHSVFPTPLSPEQEADLLKQMAEGSEEARNTLIERNLRLVAHIVKKFDNTGEEVDDLISIGTIGLIKAINTFDPEKKTRLATYAARCIENEILMHLRSTKKLRSEVLLHDPIGADKEGNEITLMDILASDQDVEERVELNVEQQKMYQGMQALTRREKKVLELRYGLWGGIRRTQREISRALGISRSYVSRIEKRALHKLQRELAPEGAK